MPLKRKQSLQIEPSEVRFLYKQNQKNPAQLRLYNPTTERIAFKILTTNPKRYIVRPYIGILEPGQVIEVLILMQPSILADMDKFNDRFAVQSVVVEEGLEEISPNDFTGSRTKDVKLRAVLEMPNNLGIISEFEDYQDGVNRKNEKSFNRKLFKRLSDGRNSSNKESLKIWSSLSKVMVDRAQHAKQNENSVYNRSVRVVDSGIRKGVCVVGEVGEIMQKGKEAFSEKMSDLKASEKIQAAKQFGGKVIATAGQQILQLSKSARSQWNANNDAAFSSLQKAGLLNTLNYDR